MASNGFQPGGQGIPAFPEEDAPQTGADYEEVARFAAFRGNTLRGTRSERDEFEFPVEGLFWSNTTDKTLDRHTAGAWVSIFGLPLDFVNPPVAGGWTTPVSQNILARRSGIAYYTFNGIRSSNAAAGAPVATVPAGYRSTVNIYGQGWGLAGAAPSVQVNYDAATNQVRLGQALVSGLAIAVTLSWPITA